MRTDGNTLHSGGLTGAGVPLPTGPRPFVERPTPRGFDWTTTGPDSGAIARLQRLGLVTVTEEILEDRPVRVVRKSQPEPEVRRPHRRTRPYVAPEWIDDAVRRYEAGETTREIGAALSVFYNTIGVHLRRAGVTMRTGRHEPVDVDVDAALALARDGLCATHIAEQLGVSPRTIRDRLAAAGIAAYDGRHDRSPNYRADLDEVDLPGQYKAGASIPDLARKYHAGTRSVRNHLLAGGVQLRDDRRHNGGQQRTPAQEEAEIVARYQAGQGTKRIAVEMHVSRSTIGNILQRAGISRGPGSGHKGDHGHDGAAALKELMRSNGVISADVRSWARATRRPIPAVGLPSRRLVEDYLLEIRTARKEPAA